MKQIRNLPYVRTKDPRLHEALSDVQEALKELAEAQSKTPQPVAAAPEKSVGPTPASTSGAGGGGSSSPGAPSDAHYVTTQAEAGLSNEANLGALADKSIVIVDVAAGVATPRAATAAEIGGKFSGVGSYLKPDGTTGTPGAGTTHSESLTDGASNFIFAAGDIVTVVGVPN